MIIQESKLESTKFVMDYPIGSGRTIEKYVDGYFLTIDDLAKLVLDFEVDYNSKDIVNTKSYIEEWLKNHQRIVKK